MEKRELEAIGFVGWEPFSLQNEKQLLQSLPAVFAVYSIVFTERCARENSCSDIAYIGKATNQKGLRHRIRQYFHPGHSNRTNIRLKEHMKSNLLMSLGYLVCQSSEQASHIESDLLLRYEKEHKELPLFNKRKALCSIMVNQAL